MNASERQGECRDTRRRLSLHLDGRLNADERSRVQDHLLECSGCARFFDEMRDTGTLVRAVANDPVASDFAERLHARIAADLSRVARPNPIVHERVNASSARRVAVIAASLVCLLGATFAAGRWSSSPRVEERTTSRTTPTPAVADATKAADDFWRVAHPFIEDVARLHGVDASARRPLVAAELAVSKLPKKAQNILATPDRDLHDENVLEAARFVTDMAMRISNEHGVPGADDISRAGIILSRVPASATKRSVFVTTRAESSSSGIATFTITDSHGGDEFTFIPGGLPEAARVQFEKFFNEFRERCGAGERDVRIKVISMPGVHSATDIQKLTAPTSAPHEP